MNGGIENRTKELKERAEAKSIVVQAAIHAIQEVSVLHKIGEGAVRSAIEVVKQDIQQYISTGPKEKITDLRNTAQDAAEEVFRELGFSSKDIIEDFNAALNKQLNLPEDAD